MMKNLFKVNEEYVDEETFQSTLEEACQAEATNTIDDLIDSCAPEVTIMSYTFSPSRILKECDHIAYCCEINDLADGIQKDALNDLERGKDIVLAGTIFEIEMVDDES